jgi:hypothetical protein
MVRRLLERAAGAIDDGPEPPDRLAEMVVAFANDNPHATRAEWVAFSAQHAAECWRSGYRRGFENVELPEQDPDRVADELDPNWRWSPDIRLVGDAGAVVLEENDEQELVASEVRAYQQWVQDRNRRRGP